MTLLAPPLAVKFLTGFGYGDLAKLFSYAPRSGFEPDGLGLANPLKSTEGAATPSYEAIPPPNINEASVKVKSLLVESLKAGSLLSVKSPKSL